MKRLVLNLKLAAAAVLVLGLAREAHTLPACFTEDGLSGNKCESEDSEQGDITHYILAEFYPSSHCRSGGNKFTCHYPDNVTLWTIHGLWPTRGTTSKPTCCDVDAEFDTDSIQDLVPRLVKEWTNLKHHTNFYHLWCHEWIKHGTCSPKSLYPLENYLNKTLTLFENGLNFGNILRKAGIEPSNSRRYSTKEIRSAFPEGAVSELKCSKIHHEKMLTEIRICLDKRSFEPTMCPGRKKSEKHSSSHSDDCGSKKIFYGLPKHLT